MEKEEGASVDGGEGGLKGNEASRQEEPRRGWSFKEKRQISPTSTSVNCPDKVLGIGSVVIATNNKMTSKAKGLLF